MFQYRNIKEVVTVVDLITVDEELDRQHSDQINRNYNRTEILVYYIYIYSRAVDRFLRNLQRKLTQDYQKLIFDVLDQPNRFKSIDEIPRTSISDLIIQLKKTISQALRIIERFKSHSSIKDMYSFKSLVDLFIDPYKTEEMVYQMVTKKNDKSLNTTKISKVVFLDDYRKDNSTKKSDVEKEKIVEEIIAKAKNLDW